MNEKKLDQSKVDQKERTKSQFKAQNRKPKTAIRLACQVAIEQYYLSLEEIQELDLVGGW